MNKRGRIRVDFKTTTELIKDNGEVFICESENLSTNGVLLKTKINLDPKKEYTIRIRLNSDEPGKGIDISVRATIVRADKNEYAFNFENMDIDSFTHLKNLVMYNTEYVEEFIDECDNKLGFK